MRLLLSSYLAFLSKKKSAEEGPCHLTEKCRGASQLLRSCFLRFEFCQRLVVQVAAQDGSTVWHLRALRRRRSPSHCSRRDTCFWSITIVNLSLVEAITRMLVRLSCSECEASVSSCVVKAVPPHTAIFASSPPREMAGSWASGRWRPQPNRRPAQFTRLLFPALH